MRIPIGRGFARSLAAGQPVFLPDVDHADVINPILRQKGIKSLLGVPLLVRGTAIGVLHVGSLAHRTFHARRHELLQLVAERVALAIERAQLHEELVALDQLKLNFVASPRTSCGRRRRRSTACSPRSLERDDLAEETRELLLRTGYAQSDRLRRLLEQLLDLSRLDAERVRSRAAAGRAAERARRDRDAAVPAGNEVELDVPENLAAVIDPLILDRIVSNLVAERRPPRHGADPASRRAARPSPAARRRGRRRRRARGAAPASLRALRARRGRGGHRPRPRDRQGVRARPRRRPPLRPARAGARFELVVPQG